MEKAAFILSLIGLGIDVLIVFWQAIQEKDKRKVDRQNELVRTMQNRIDEYSNMTTSVIFAQLTNMYQELSILLYKNYDNIMYLITTPDTKITSEIDNIFREMCITIEANSYIFKSDLNELLWTYKDMTESILDCIANKELDTEHLVTNQIDELYNVYKEIKQYFKTDLQDIQLDVSTVFNDFIKEYRKLK